MKSKQYPSEVYVLRKRVKLSSESSQLISGEAVNKIRMGRQVLKKQGLKGVNHIQEKTDHFLQSYNLTFLHSYIVRFRRLTNYSNNNIYYNIYYY